MAARRPDHRDRRIGRGGAGVGRALSRLFHREFGCGPATGLELVRLARARSLLTRSNLTITQVARTAGFNDPLYFSRRFRAVHGRSPSAYRTDGGGGQSYPVAVHGLTRRLYGD